MPPLPFLELISYSFISHLRKQPSPVETMQATLVNLAIVIVPFKKQEETGEINICPYISQMLPFQRVTLKSH